MTNQKILLIMVFWLALVNAQLQFNVEFQIDNHTTSQIVYLFDLNTFESSTQDVFLNRAHSSFNLRKNDHLIFLEYRKTNDLKCNGENYQLELVLSNQNGNTSNSIVKLNVTIYDYKAKLEECYKLLDNRLNVEYIFKLSNDSDYGLIKDDMSSNGIIAIIRIDSSLANLTSRNELQINKIHYDNRYLDLENKYFMLKKFMPNFYMLCLTENTRYLSELVNDNNKIEVELSLMLNKITIAVKSLKFNLINAKHLEIQLVHQTESYNSEAKIYLETTEQYGKDCNLMTKYGGVHLFKPELYLENKLFQTEQDYQVYMEKNVRFALAYSNVDIVELDSLNGNLYVSSGKCLDREELEQFDSILRINLTALDQRKLFKSINISLNIRVKDLNDNEPRFKQNEYYLRLNQDLLLNKRKKEIVIFDEKAIDFDLEENSSLFYELIEATSYLNSKSISSIYLFHLKHNKVVTTTKIFQREEKYFALRLLCRDNGKPESKYTVITINLVIESNKPSQIISADFDLNYDNLKQEATKLGSLQVNSLYNESLEFNSSSKYFKLELDSHSNFMISKLGEALIDKFSFVKFENLDFNLLVFVKFSSVDRNQFGQNLYEFVYAEDHMANLTSNLIGFLETDCNTISSITVASDYAYLFKFETRNNQILVISQGDLDYEIETSYDLKVYAVCNQIYLMSTRVRIKLIDVNDNEPQFLNPIVSNQIFYKQIQSRNDSLINVTRIRAVDHDRTDEFSLLKFRIKSSQLFYINESTGDLYFKMNDHLQANTFLNYTIEVTTFNDYQTELVSNYNSKSVSIRVVLFIQTRQVISTVHQQIKSNSFVSFDLMSDIFYEVIDKCWLTIDFKQSDQIELYHFSLHDKKLSFFKRNNYLDLSQQQYVIECQLVQLNNNYNLIGWTQLSAFRASSLSLQDFIKTKELHYDLNRFDLLDSKTQFKIDQFFDLNIPFSYFLLYSLNSDNSDVIKSNLVMNRFSGELSTKIIDKNWNKIVSSADLLALNIDVSLLHNRHEQKNFIRVYLHLTNSPKSSLLLDLKTQLDQVKSRLTNTLVRVKITSLKKNFYLVPINKANEYAESKLNFTIQKLLKLDLNNNNDIELIDTQLLAIHERLSDGFYETNLVLNLDYLKLVNEFEAYYQIQLKACPNVSNDSEIGLSFDLSQECEMITLNLVAEFSLNLNEFKFEYESYNLRFAWSNTSANVALLDLKSFITNNSYLNFNLIKFRAYSDLVIVNEQTGLVYLSSYYYFDQIELNVSLIEVSSDKTISTTKLRVEFYQKQQVNLIVQLDDENTTEKIVVTRLNQTASNKLEVICLSLSQHVCYAIFEMENSMLILNEYETRRYLSSFKQQTNRVRRVEILIKLNKNDLIEVNLDLEINGLKEIQQPTFEYSRQLVYLVEINEKKASFSFETKNENGTQIEMTRVKNLITNNEVLALDCEFKLVNKSNYLLKLDDVMSLEMNQIYSFDFNVTQLEMSYFSSLYVVRLNQLILDSVVTQKQFVSLVFDDSASKQLIMNLSRENEDNPFSVFTQKIYLISKYSRLNVKYFKIYDATLYLVNAKYNCEKVVSSSSSINILKFYIDKISLRIKKVIEIELHLEILRTQRASMPKYHHKVEMLKTDLLTYSNHELDDLIIYQFNLTRGDYEFSIDYSNSNLPFEIDQFSGKLKYLPSEDNFEFDINGEKYFAFDIQIASASNQIDLFKFEFVLIDNDPIVLDNENSLYAKFYIDSSFVSKKLIGHVDLINIVESKYLKEVFKHNKQSLNFRIQDKESFFFVDKHNGLIYLKNSIESLEFDVCSFSLRVNGTIGHKIALISVNVLVVVTKLVNFELDGKLNDEIDFYLNSTNKNLETFKMTSMINNLDLHAKVRFKNLTDLSEICQLSWLNGEIFCSIEKFNQLNLKKLTLSILIISKIKNGDLFVRHVKVNLINFESYLNNMKSLFYPKLESNNQIDLRLALQQKVNLKLRDNINQRLNDLGFKIDLINHRFIFSSDQMNSSSRRISSYFNLDQFSSQLEQFRLVDESIRLEDTIQIIELLEENNFKIFKTINIELTIEKSFQIPWGFKNAFVFNIDLNNMTNNSQLIVINNIYEIFPNQENVEYFLSEEKVDASTDYASTESTSLENQFKVYLNKTTGELVIDKSNIYYPCSFNFYLIAKYANSAQRFEQISYQVNFNYGFRANLITRLLNDLYESSLEFQIVLDTKTLNDSRVLDLNSLLFNEAYLIANFDLNLASTSMQKHLPFEIDRFNKSLKYRKTNARVHSSTHELIITMNNDFDFMIKFILKNDHHQALVFDSHLYNVEISFLDFNNLNKLVLERVQADYLLNGDDSKKAKSVLYQLVDQDLVSSTASSMKRNLRKLIKLDPYKGEIELVRKSWSLFLDYCNQLNQYESNHLAILYTISAIDKETSLEAKSVLKLVIKCDQLKETFQFEKSSYVISLNEETKVGSFITRINTKKTLLNSSVKLNYYFCNLKMNSALLNPFSLSQKTGNIYLNNQLNKANFSFEICANIENNFMNKIIRTNLYILVRNEKKFEFDVFNKNSEDQHLIEIPISSLDEKKSFKLFQLSMSHSSKHLLYDSMTQDSDLLQLNSTNGWLSLTINDRNSLNNAKFNFKAIVSDYKFKRELNFKFSFFHFNQTNNFIIELNYPYQRIFDIKQLFRTNYNYIVIEPNQFVVYNSTDGLLIVKKYALNRVFQCDLKLVSVESDIKLGVVQINPLNQLKNKRIISNNELFISKYSQMNTIVYNLNDISDRIEELLSESSLFSLSSNAQAVYLSGDLLGLHSKQITLSLVTKYQFIKLTIHLIENLYESLSFTKFSYYFKYSLSTNDFYVGSVDLNLKKEIFLKLVSQFKLNSFQLNETICLLATRTSSSTKAFYLKNNIDIYFNTSAYDFSCSLYRVLVRAELDFRNISAYVFIELDNFRLESNKSGMYSTYSILLDNSTNEINLNDSFKYDIPIKLENAVYSASLILDESQNSNHMEYSLNQLKRLLKVYFDKNVNHNKVYLIKINVLIQSENDFFLIQQFKLNLMLKSDKIHFREQSITCELNYLQQNRIFNDRLVLLDLNKYLIKSNQDSLNMTIARSSISNFLELDSQENIVYFNSNSMLMNKRYYFNLSQLIEISICQLSDCQTLMVHLKLNILEQDAHNLVIEYYSLAQNNILVKTKSFFKNVNLIKLKNFNSNYFSVVNNLTNIISLDKTTNVMSIKSNDLKDIFSLDGEQFKVEVAYDSKKPITFSINYIENSNRLMSSDLSLDVFYNGEITNQSIYLVELVQNGFGCELWEKDSITNEKIEFLHSSCKLLINFNSTEYSSNQKINLQIRAFDKESMSKSVFFLVKLNLIKIDFDSKKSLLVTSSSRQKLNSLNKNLKSKFNSYIIGEVQTESQALLIRTLDEFNNNLVNKLVKFLDNTYGVGNYEVINPFKAKSCQSKLIFESANNAYYYDLSRLQIDYKKLIQTPQYMLISPDLLRQIESNSHKNDLFVQNEIKFPNLKSLLLDSSELEIQNRIFISFMFKIESKSSFLFSLSALATKFNLYTNDSILQMSYLNSLIIFNKNIQLNKWYQFEITIQSQEIQLIIKKYAAEKEDFLKCDDSSFEIQSNEISEFDHLNFESILIGSESYSDMFSLADFRFNEYELFKHNKFLNTLTSDKYSLCHNNNSTQIFSSNCQLAVGSFKSHLNGKLSKVQFKKLVNNRPTSNAFELSIKFKLKLSNISLSQLKEITLLQSFNSNLNLNFQNSTTLELYELGKMIGWIDIPIKSNISYDFRIHKKRDGTLQFVLNDVERVFLSNLSFRSDLTNSAYVEVNSRLSHLSDKSFILFEEIRINNERVPLYDGFSPSYETKFVLIESNDFNCCYFSSNFENNAIRLKESDTNSEDSLMNSIIIATILMSLTVLLGIFFLVFSYSNGKLRSAKIEKIISEKASKFNSRNKLELSINSEQNSLDHSLNSSFAPTHAPSVLVQSKNLDNLSSTSSKQYITPLNNEKQKQIFQNSQFDFGLLNWQPTYEEFKFVIKEFQEFPCNTNALLDQNRIYHEAENQIDIYLRQDNFEISSDIIDKQTFV